MITEERRYILIDFNEVTQAIIDACIQTSIETLRHVQFTNDITDWVVLKWSGNKPEEMWNEFPVHSDQEMRDILKSDLISIQEANTLLNGTPN